MNQPKPDEPVIEGRKLIIVSLLSGLVWLLLANLIIYYIQETKLAELFFAGYHFLIQLGIGLISGVIFGFAGLGLIRLKTFKRILNEYAIIRQVKQMDLSVKEIVYVSLVAGISE